MKSILECSKKTAIAIAQRMELRCFECGWNECPCDIHHIIPQSKGGSDKHSNLSYLCPNCHRKAHRKLLGNLRSFEEVIGDEWKKFYNVRSEPGVKFEFTPKMEASLILARSRRTIKTKAVAQEKIRLLEKAAIDKTVHGWIQQASEILEIAPQSVARYLRKHKPAYLDGAKLRNSNAGMV